MRVAIWARVSTDDQAADGKVSVPGQLAKTRAYAENTLVADTIEEFVEEGVSGALEYTDRPEVSRLLAMAEAGQLDAVVWAKADRQGRSTTEVGLIEARLARSGVTVHTAEGGARIV